MLCDLVLYPRWFNDTKWMVSLHDMHEISFICRWCGICLAEILKSAETNSIFLDLWSIWLYPYDCSCICLRHVTPSKTNDNGKNTQPCWSCYSGWSRYWRVRQEALHFSSTGMCPEFFQWCLWNLPKLKTSELQVDVTYHTSELNFSPVIREEINYLLIQCDLFISQLEVT